MIPDDGPPGLPPPGGVVQPAAAAAMKAAVTANALRRTRLLVLMLVPSWSRQCRDLPFMTRKPAARKTPQVAGNSPRTAADISTADCCAAIGILAGKNARMGHVTANSICP